MADITISDLELAPALADDMVIPVENTTDTYAATLAMLRRLLNKTFVEEEDADFNDLTDDGFYQCTGTPTNAPEAGTINWTLQVSAESGVVVQRAFSLDDNFANLYIRRWNGVTWTAWIEEGGRALTGKANIDLDNLSATGQAKFDAKANTNASNFTATGKANVVDWGMPDYSTGVSFNFVIGGSFTAPYDCFVKVICYGSGNSFGAKIYNTGVYLARITPTAGQFLSEGFTLSKGDWFTMEGAGVAQLVYFKLKGVN